MQNHTTRKKKCVRARVLILMLFYTQHLFARRTFFYAPMMETEETKTH